MATNTYVALSTQTVSSAVSSVTFSSIPQGYTDLVLVVAGTCSAGSYFTLRFNSDTSTNYSNTEIVGDGASASSSRNSNSNYMYIGAIRTTQTNIITHIQNYSNTTTYKTVLSRTNNAATETKAVVGLWRGTPAAITTIDVGTGGANTFQPGSTFTLYGIANADTFTKATGGTLYEDSTYWYHVFGSSGTFTPKQSLTADVLVIAGGGGGGGVATSTSNYGGSGAAGGVSYLSGGFLTTTNYSITVGAGGAGGVGNAVGATGSASNFNSSVISNGGGGGANNNVSSGAGISGGSGSGGAGNTTAGLSTQGNTGGATGYGNAGGAGSTGAGQNSIGGSGGAGGAGGAGVQNTSGGNGGSGLNTWSSWMTATGFGVNGYIAGGGAGFLQNGTAIGTSNAGAGVPAAGGGTAATANTGSGGGGSIYSSGSANGGNGGSGVVIIRYPK